jgi:hypothetical protein
MKWFVAGAMKRHASGIENLDVISARISWNEIA